MAYEVLARKWRPQQFEDVVGQSHVTQTLQNAIRINRIAHAYLFVGPRGIGKTSLARIFAKALNCETGPTATPCDRCDACREIAAGSSLDVLEIDGASNTGVDQVRELRDNVKFAPTRGTYKIYIIDEVHMLSTAAFNALLKTLEEPPPHVKFFFATTEAHKVLPTIVSRCQRFDLRRIPAPLIVERLHLIAREEKVTLDNDAALAIARGAEGGLRDAESALDQLIAFRGNTIGEEDVLSVFGLVSRGTLDALALAVLQGKVAEVVRLVSQLDAGGKDMQRLVLELLDHFRNLLIVLCAPDAAGELDVVSTQLEGLKAQAPFATPDRLMRIAEILSQAEDRMRFSLSRRTLVETALIRCARSTTVSIEDLLRRVDALSEAIGGGGAVASEARSATPPASASAPAARPVPPAPAPAARPSPPPAARPAPAAAPAASAADDLELLTGQWREIIEKVARVAALARGLLLDARPLAVEGDRVVIGFDPEFARHLERMQNPHFMKATQGVLGQLLKRTVHLELKLIDGEGQADVPADHTAEQSAAGGKGGARTKADWLKDPTVRKSLELFNGSIVDIRE